jgi:hypothetical protein
MPKRAGNAKVTFQGIGDYISWTLTLQSVDTHILWKLMFVLTSINVLTMWSMSFAALIRKSFRSPVTKLGIP